MNIFKDSKILVGTGIISDFTFRPFEKEIIDSVPRDNR